jgi:hypothetical protein
LLPYIFYLFYFFSSFSSSLLSSISTLGSMSERVKSKCPPLCFYPQTPLIYVIFLDSEAKFHANMT